MSRARGTTLLAGGGLAAVALAGCTTTAERSARIAAQGQKLLSSGSTIDVSKPNRDVRVRRTAVLGSAAAGVVAVELENTGTKPQAVVPLLVRVRGAGGKQVYANDTPGLQPSLQSVAVLRPGKKLWWVDDQVTATARPKSVAVKVGAGRPLPAAPRITLRDVHFTSDAGGRYLTGIVHNATGRVQNDAPVSVVALRGSKVVGAGRALVPVLPVTPGPKPTRFRVFLTGDAAGARLVLSVSPTSLT